MGNVRNTKIGFTNIFKPANKIATKNACQAESTFTCGNKYVVSKIAKADTRI